MEILAISIEHNLTCSFRGCINFGDHCWYRNNESGMCSNIGLSK